MESCQNCLAKLENSIKLECCHFVCRQCIQTNNCQMEYTLLEEQSNSQTYAQVKCPLENCQQESKIEMKDIQILKKSESNDSFELVGKEENLSDTSQNQNTQNQKSSDQINDYVKNQLNYAKVMIETQQNNIQQLQQEKADLNQQVQNLKEDINLEQKEKNNLQLKVTSLESLIENIKCNQLNEAETIQKELETKITDQNEMLLQNKQLQEQNRQLLNKIQIVATQKELSITQISQEIEKYKVANDLLKEELLNQQKKADQKGIQEQVQILKKNLILRENEVKVALQDKHKIIEASQKEITSLKDEIFNNQRTHQQIKDQIARKNQEIQNQKDSLDYYNNLNEEMKKTVSRLQNELAIKKNSLNNLQILNNPEVQNIIQSYVCQIEDQKKEIQSMKREHQQIQQIQQTQFTTLYQDFSKCQDQYKEINKQLQEILQENENLKHQVNESQNQIAMLNQQLMQYNQSSQLSVLNNYNKQIYDQVNQERCQNKNYQYRESQKLECDFLNCMKKSQQVQMLKCFHSFCADCLKTQIQFQTDGKIVCNENEKGNKIWCPFQCQSEIGTEIVQKVFGEDAYQKALKEALVRKLKNIQYLY